MKLIYPIISNLKELFDNKYVRLFIDTEFEETEKELLNGILKGVICTDVQASKAIYGSHPSHPTYQSFKTTLKKKLLQIMSLVTPKGNTNQVEHIKAYKHYYVFRCLLILGLRKPAIIIGKKLYEECLNYQIYDIAIDIGRLLSRHYIIYTNNKSKGHYYHEEVLRILEILNFEIRAEWAYSLVMCEVKKSYEINEELAFLARDQANKLQNNLDIDSGWYHYYYYSLRAVQYSYSGEKEMLIKNYKEALSYFEGLYFDHSMAKSIFYAGLINVYCETGDLAKAELLLKSVLTEMDENRSTGSHYWFRFNEILTKVYLHIGSFSDAYTQYKNAISNKRFRNEADFVKSRWVLIEAYLQLVHNEEINIRRLKHRLTRFSQDKKGANIPLMILELMYYIKTGNEDKVLDRFDSLKRYVRKYLSDGNNERTRIFVTMILAKLSYKEDLAEDLAQQLQNLQSIQPEEIEIVKYEHLWKLVESVTMKLYR